MAKYYSNETAVIGNTPPAVPGNEAYGGRKRVYRATIPLDAPKLNSSQNGTQVTGADTVFLCRVPAGMRFICGRLTSNVSLGTAQIAIGTAASVGKYRAAAVFTATDTPTLFGTTAAMAAGPLGADEEISLAVAVAALPNGAGNTLVVDLEFAAP